jgi:hypothetical protein
MPNPFRPGPNRRFALILGGTALVAGPVVAIGLSARFPDDGLSRGLGPLLIACGIGSGVLVAAAFTALAAGAAPIRRGVAVAVALGCVTLARLGVALAWFGPDNDLFGAALLLSYVVSAGLPEIVAAVATAVAHRVVYAAPSDAEVP